MTFLNTKETNLPLASSLSMVSYVANLSPKFLTNSIKALITASVKRGVRISDSNFIISISCGESFFAGISSRAGRLPGQGGLGGASLLKGLQGINELNILQ